MYMIHFCDQAESMMTQMTDLVSAFLSISHLINMV